MVSEEKTSSSTWRDFHSCVFHGSGAGPHCSRDKTLVNSKALRDGGKFRELLEHPVNPDIIYSFCKHLLSY